MSIQLVLYPQNYNGQFNSITTNPSEFVVNGISFVGLDSASSYDNANFQAVDVLAAAPPAIVNTWYRFRAPVGALPALPTVASGTAVFNSLGTVSVSGIYQRLSNLSVGQTYTINVNVSTTGSGTFTINVYDGTTQIATQGALASVATITTTFTATAADNTLLFLYSASTVGNVAIEDISVTQEGSTPSVTLTDGQVICDLYEDEDIPLTLSVDDFTNTAEQVKSYSKAFQLPGTKRNNQIFDNIFEITRADDGIVFNPYVKTQCTLKQDGFVLLEGYLRLIDISDKEEEISYNVNLYSEVIALADVLEERAFQDLDFTELEHAYNRTNIVASWTGSVTYINPETSDFRDNDTLKYPFCNWTNQLVISNGSTPNATVGMPELTSLEQAFRPFINIKYIIDRIFSQPDFPFSYTSSFFDTTDFKKLYMDFNWGASRYTLQEDGVGEFIAGSPSITSTTSFQSYVLNDFANFTDALNYDSTNHQFVALQNNTEYIISPIVSFANHPAAAVPTGDLHVRIAHKDAGGALIQEYQLQSFSLSNFSSCTYTVLNQSVILQQNETLGVEWKSDVLAEYEQFTNGGNVILAQTGGGMITTATYLQNLRGELGQWEFLKGIFTMFNLISVPDESNPTNIIIEPYKDIFLSSNDAANPNFFDNNSTELNWTEKVDIEEIKLTPLTELSKNTIFKFVEDDDDFAFQNYKTQVQGHLYGSQLFNAEISANGLETMLSGEQEIVAEPFAATVPKPLDTPYPELIVPALYSYNVEDDTSEGFDNSPRIMYNNGVVSMVSDTYYIPEQNNVTYDNSSDFLQFTHLSDIPTIVSNPPLATDTRDFHFGICQLIPPIGNATPNNLFNTYWLPYFNELYNANTRIMTLKVNLGGGDINTFKFYDLVMIKNRKFRVNKIDYKPNDLSTVEFILIP